MFLPYIGFRYFCIVIFLSVSGFQSVFSCSLFRPDALHDEPTLRNAVNQIHTGGTLWIMYLPIVLRLNLLQYQFSLSQIKTILLLGKTAPAQRGLSAVCLCTGWCIRTALCSHCAPNGKRCWRLLVRHAAYFVLPMTVWFSPTGTRLSSLKSRLIPALRARTCVRTSEAQPASLTASDNQKGSRTGKGTFHNCLE